MLHYGGVCGNCNNRRGDVYRILLAYLGESFHLCSAIILTNNCSLYIVVENFNNYLEQFLLYENVLITLPKYYNSMQLSKSNISDEALLKYLKVISQLYKYLFFLIAKRYVSFYR